MCARNWLLQICLAAVAQLGLIILLVKPVPCLAESLEFGPAVDLSGSYSGPEPVLVSSRGKILVFWSEYGRGAGGTDRIIVRESLDQGRSFSAARVIAELPQLPSRFAVLDGSIFACWDASNLQGKNQIYFSVSHNIGESFSAPVNISQDFADSRLCKITATHGNIHVFWTEVSGPFSTGKFYVRSSQNSGQTFGAAVSLLNEKLGEHLSVAHSAEVTYMAWGDQSEAVVSPRHIYFSSIPNPSTRPQFERRLTASKVYGAPHVLALGNEALVTWDSGPAVITRLTNSGRDLGGVVELSPIPVFPQEPGAIAINPRLSANGRAVIAAWTVSSGPRQVVELAQSTDGGRTFGPSRLVSTRLAYSTVPNFAVGRSITFMAWPDDRPTINVMAARDGHLLTDVPATTQFQIQRELYSPQIAAVDDSAVVAWLDKPSVNVQKVFVRQVTVRR